MTIKKYANRRLYNTATSSYVTLDHLCQMVKDGVDFVVYDAKTGEDITRAVLTQIIVEEESKGQNLLPIGFLRQLISFYGDNLQMVVPGYLESSMAAFAQNQERMRSYMEEAFGGMYPFGSIEDMTKRNLSMLEQAMTMFAPQSDGGAPGSGPVGGAPGAGSSGGQDAPRADASAYPSTDETAAAVRQLQTQLETLQRQLLEIGTGTRSGDDAKSS
ncbi:MAG: polyhydroxyalkanoate synthesis repressor PhaR [Thalassobaculaceae bacterium]